MAVCKLGTTVVGLRGTIGGITYQQNKSGPTAKVWARSAQSNAPYQQLCRGQMARWGDVWRGLTPAEQADWDSFAAAPPETDYDRFGTLVYRTGFQWLCRLNQRRALLTSTPLALAPVATVQVIPVCTNLVCHIPTVTPFLTTFDHTDTEWGPADLCVVKASLVSSTGQRQVRRGFKLITIQLPGATTQTDITGGMELRFTWWPAGWQLVTWIYRMNTDGIRSVPCVLTTEVVA